MFLVSEEKCSGCGLCIGDCPAKDIIFAGQGKAYVKNKNCIKCGHCIAICPKEAVLTDEYSMDEVRKFDREKFTITASRLDNFIKFRRSAREFLPQGVEREKILQVLNAGRFAPTGGNRQNVSYVVITEEKEQVRIKALKTLYEISDTYINSPEWIRQRFGRNWVKMYEDYREDENAPDRLFFGAPVIILIKSNMASNTGPAAGYMELMAQALGLGVCFVNFFVRALENSEELRNILGLSSTDEVVYCMVLGYTNLKYQRTVPRQDLQVVWR